MPDAAQLLDEMNDRSRDVFRNLVEAYLETGEPIGSRTLARGLAERVSPATIRNVMQDLEHLGLLESPHVSAGRIPTQHGLRLFVDGLLEVADLDQMDRQRIEQQIETKGDSDIAATLDRAGRVLSALTRGASLVLAPKHEAPIRHIEFVALGPDRALVVLVTADGHVENRVFTPPPGQTPSTMRAAANFLNALADAPRRFVRQPAQEPALCGPEQEPAREPEREHRRKTRGACRGAGYLVNPTATL
jgi:heat-inducible transcriptional repressor